MAKNRLIIKGATFTNYIEDVVISASALLGTEEVTLSGNVFSIYKASTSQLFFGGVINGAKEIEIQNLPNIGPNPPSGNFWWGVMNGSDSAFVFRFSNGAIEAFTFTNGFQTASKNGQTQLSSPTVTSSNTLRIVLNGDHVEMYGNGSKIFDFDGALRICVISSAATTQTATFTILK